MLLEEIKPLDEAIILEGLQPILKTLASKLPKIMKSAIVALAIGTSAGAAAQVTSVEVPKKIANAVAKCWPSDAPKNLLDIGQVYSAFKAENKGPDADDVFVARAPLLCAIMKIGIQGAKEHWDQTRVQKESEVIYQKYQDGEL